MSIKEELHDVELAKEYYRQRYNARWNYWYSTTDKQNSTVEVE